MSLADRLNIPDSRRGRAGESSGRSPRQSPYVSPAFNLAKCRERKDLRLAAVSPTRPTSDLPADGNWVHDKFAEVNDLPKGGGKLASRISGGTARGPSGPTRLFEKAITGSSGEAPRRGNPGGRVPSGSGSSLSIKGVSAPPSTTLEIRELLAGTSPEDVKLIFAETGQIDDAWALPSENPQTTVIRVKYADRNAMIQAILKFDQQQADGRVLSVKEIVAPPVPQGSQTSILDGEKKNFGKMYSDQIEGGVTLDRPPRVDVMDDKWTRGNGRGRGGRGRGGRGRGRGSTMEVD